MDHVGLLVALASTGLAGFLIVATALLKAWSGWLELKRDQVTRAVAADSFFDPAGRRSELTDLRERIGRLEAIASGVDGGR